MKKKIFLTLLFAAFFLGCAAPKKGKLSNKQKDNWYLSVEETPCFGKCPMYEIVIDGKGNATMTGKRFVEPIGEAISIVADSTLKNLIILAAKAQWNTYSIEYKSGYSDLPSTIIRYSIEPGDTFTIRYENKLAPVEVTQIGDALIEYRKQAAWSLSILD